MTAPSDEDNIPAEYIECLHKCFGHSKFRAMQWKVISSILYSDRDNCVIMATGYGKSLCYQFPSVYRNTITIVVSPLISLMQDQVMAMHSYGLKACFLGSAQENPETKKQVINHQYNVVYVTPEYITNETGRSLLNCIKEQITLIAIDEAHCISKWGNDFRYAYRNLNRIRLVCPNAPILAMTATATPQVRDDIIKSLQLRNVQIVSTSFDRPNLEFVVKATTKVWDDIGPYIKNVTAGSIIIYCITRQMTKKIASVIRENGQICLSYHAGFSLLERKKIQDDFMQDRVRIVVATIAFGMGINKPDVRLVINYGVAKDVESYYQEVGRAGRDGLPAKCIMFYGQKDWSLHRTIRKESYELATKEHMDNLMIAMNKYVDTTQCRRRYILLYFGEDCSKLIVRPNCCDNCRRTLRSNTHILTKYNGLDTDGLLDITDEASKLLKLLVYMRDLKGLRKAYLVLKGSKSKSLEKYFGRHALYGSLKHKSEKWLKAVSNSLLRMQMLEMVTPPHTNTYHRCRVTSKGKIWIRGIVSQNPIKVLPGNEFLNLLHPMTTATSAAAPSEVYRSLSRVHTKLAEMFDMKLSTKDLQKIAKIQPTTIDELKTIKLDGHSTGIIDRFGPALVKAIKEFHAKKAKQTNECTPPEHSCDVIDQPSNLESASKVAVTHLPSSVVKDEILLISDESDEELDDSRQDATISLPPNGEIHKNTLSQDSVEIIEPTPPSIIEIDSDLESVSLENLEPEVICEIDEDPYCRILDPDSDDKALLEVVDEVEIQSAANCQNLIADSNDNAKIQSTDVKRPSNFVNSELEFLIDTLKNDKFVQDPPISNKPSDKIKHKQETDSDVFNGVWDSEINEADLTQISEEAEQKLKCDSKTVPLNKHIQSSNQPPDPIAKAPQNELDLLIGAIELDLHQNDDSKRQKKPHIITRKPFTGFEYENDSSSESEDETNRTVSPKKRTLPSWMHTNKKKRR